MELAIDPPARLLFIWKSIVAPFITCKQETTKYDDTDQELTHTVYKSNDFNDFQLFQATKVLPRKLRVIRLLSSWLNLFRTLVSQETANDADRGSEAETDAHTRQCCICSCRHSKTDLHTNCVCVFLLDTCLRLLGWNVGLISVDRGHNWEWESPYWVCIP